MTYCDGGTDFDDVIRHLRNKSIGVYPRRWSPMLKVALFDLVISISTIEHLGPGNYDDVQIPDGDRLGVERLWRLVRPGGRHMATVPAGRRDVQRGYRIYDEARLHMVFPDLVATSGSAMITALGRGRLRPPMPCVTEFTVGRTGACRSRRLRSSSVRSRDL